MVEMSFKYHAAPPLASHNSQLPWRTTHVDEKAGSGHGLVSHERGRSSNYERISKGIFMMFYWSVVSNMAFIFHFIYIYIYIWDVIPTLLTKSIIFQDGHIAHQPGIFYDVLCVQESSP